MKKLSFKSRFSHGILLLILLSGAITSALIMHNIILQLGGRISLIPIILILFAIGAGVMLYQKAASNYRQFYKKTEELEHLKKAVEQARKAEEEKEVAKKSKENQEQTVVDFDAEVQSVIPLETFENNEQYIEKLLANVANKFEIVQGIVFLYNPQKKKFCFSGGYAYFSEEIPREFSEGETLSGQVAKNKILLNLDNVPEGYITILSGLGKGTPKNLIIAPVLTAQSECIGVIELASFKPFTKDCEKVFELLGKSVGVQIENKTLSNEE
ncbi:MAG TPA: GAF domain-containing protein [Tenuifilaceae bacterium]|nr:GAF domain-containing protein [Tenuifilaceae bacterium]HPE18132.1 GAF domain-containing protein [Tenuifilaceae bacterium]HPJ45713.1 GAF domain-containing protein [Tenuifilaceae bacterium]HPQ34275.1 GAF domain-containing protein [Tenuifilaceae bacterium]HRX67769.1 GAF domain-containing protein [Tenuifilaceae bacterium]